MKKTGFLVLMTIFALGALGIGYSAWQENFTINGTANAATWNVRFQTADADADNYATAAFAGLGTDTLTVTLNNVYPGLQAKVHYVVATSSTIPINFASYNVNLGTLPTGVTITGAPPAGPIGSTSGGYDDSQGNFTVTFPSALTLTDMPSGSTYTFTVSFVVVQATP